VPVRDRHAFPDPRQRAAGRSGAILLFRRSDEGSVVTSLASVPRLVEALHRAEPGELLANGFFNDPL